MKEIYILSPFYILEYEIIGVFGNTEAIKKYIKEHHNEYYDGSNFYYYKDAEVLPNNHVNIYYEGLDYPVDDLFYAEKYQVIE